MSEKFMAPPWLKYPELFYGCIGWRMGYGECYMEEYLHWLDGLNEAKRKEFEEKFPKPVSWDHSKIIKNGDYAIAAWRCEGSPKYSAGDIAGNDKKIFFWKHHPVLDSVGRECFSQWYEAGFSVGHRHFWCAEQFMMAEKARLFGDTEAYEKIMASKEQSEIKALGRGVRGFDEELWDKFKYRIVVNGNYYKFSENKVLRKYIMSTEGAVLAEASPFDRIWGIGMAEDKARNCDPKDWKGENMLGFALMEVREEIIRLWKYADELDFDCLNE
ncbi:NADAR family protein [Huintestinicola sp.]|uniref:NADAR family protein n=1 Tax=Huintestinicola sp. TaxID=2981661 RepID=UPI003D7CF777